MLPRALEDATEALTILPGVGAKSAERYACYLLKTDREQTAKLSEALATLHDGVKSCPVTFALIDKNEAVSDLYADLARDKSQIVVVEEPLDIIPLEKTGDYHGTYHVLGGVLSPIDGLTPDKLHIKELFARIEKDRVAEVIVATNASVEGESTAIYLEQELHKLFPKLKLSRLARGIPMGVDLGYTDQLTLSQALKNRTAI